MKITLAALNASYIHTNLAVRCIARALTLQNHTVQIVERSLKDRSREFLRALYETNADVYGFSIYIWNREEMLQTAAQLHLLRPAAKIVLGGPEISYEDDSFFVAHPYVDNILAGEGETVFPAFCAAFPPRHTVLCGEPYADFATAGILYDLYPPTHTGNGGILYYESSRGCPFSCSYCLSSATRGVRSKSAEQTIAEIQRLAQMPGVRIVKFIDRTFNFDRRRADTIWRAIAAGDFSCTFHFEVCADLLDEENFATLVSMPQGRIQLECGVQSTNPATLAAIGRTSDPQKILSALARIRAMDNIHIHADLIAGLPEEDFARFAQSFDETYPVCDLLQLGFLKLLPGTALRKSCAQLGYRYAPHPPYEVLQSDRLSFEELCRLHDIDAVLDRFAGSGRFSRALAQILADEPSPFAFFDALAAAIPPPTSLSQREAFLALRNFALRRGVEERALDRALILDWLCFEAGTPPYPLRVERAPEEIQLRRQYCAAQLSAELTSVAAYTLPTGETVLADRKNHFVCRLDDFTKI